MQFAVVIAEGPNSVEVPCRIFSDLAKAEAFCDELLKDAEKSKEEDGIRYYYQDEISDNIAEVMFTNYYGGCGECYAFTLKLVNENEKFVGFDLD